MNSIFPNISDYAIPYVFSLIIGNVIGFAIWQLNILINRFWNWKQFPILKIPSLIITFTLVSVVLAQLLFPYFVNLYYASLTDAIPVIDYTNLRLQFVILSFNLVLIYVLIDYLIFSYKNFIYHKINIVKEQKERSQLQLEMLQKQLSPHYLFNSLNTISSLIESSANIAEKYIRKLVNTYKYILSISQKELVSLKQELKMIKAYQYQLEVRFGTNIKWNYAVSDDLLNKYLPPLSLQILVENAVKHNVASAKQALEISIEGNNNVLVVKNNVTETSEKPISHKIGLKNLQHRYKLLGDYKVITHKGENFEVMLPLLDLT